MSQDLESLKDWIGRSETEEDRATVRPVHGYAALRDRDDVPKEGDPIGPMGHWFFFKPVVPASQIQCRQRLGGLLKHYYRRAA